MNYGGPGQEVSEGNDMRTWVGDHFCDIFTKNVTVFCSCFKNLPRTKLKNIGLIFFGGGDFKTVLQICNEEEQVGQTEIENVLSEEKIAPGNLMFEPKLVLKEIIRLIKGLI